VSGNELGKCVQKDGLKKGVDCMTSDKEAIFRVREKNLE
jgi:hypothetical protein